MGTGLGVGGKVSRWFKVGKGVGRTWGLFEGTEVGGGVGLIWGLVDGSAVEHSNSEEPWQSSVNIARVISAVKI
jgi:hypothetical protein